MKIAVLADEKKWQELTTEANIEWIKCLTEKHFFEYTEADVYLNLMENAFTNDYTQIKEPILINSVSAVLKEINAPENVLRINGWNGFLSRANWEVTGKLNEATKQFFLLINKTTTIVKDEPGLISARVISMIINEAYFALEENLSTCNEIDTAMKLGTNYPYGPFEWCDKIGAENVYALLKKLSLADKRYLPSPLLKKQATL